ncbi:uncharacterized protein TNCV_2777531 [Trichonephila clavipes]|nr:uncharacterized protein TNCV_2777531 [Trichonephila clavipes]
MDVCKCIVPLRHGGTLNSRQSASPLVRLGEERWESSDHPQGVLPLNWGGTEQKRTVTCMVLEALANDRRHLAMMNFVGLDRTFADQHSESVSFYFLKRIFSLYLAVSSVSIFYLKSKFSLVSELISKKALEDHIDLVHNITIEKDTRTFDTFQDFKLWKESIEKQTSSLYVKNTASKSGKSGGKMTYFYCHRSGFYNARGDMKRNMKIAGSNKINGKCPSKMKVYEDIESKVTVEFTKTHVGHGIDLGRMKITREEKEGIA